MGTGRAPRRSWTVILVGRFTRSRYPDLLFYDAAAGLVEIYATDASGNITLVKGTPNLPGNWTLGLACNVTSLNRQTGWRQSWSIIAPGVYS